MVRNTYIYPPGPSLRIISDIMGYTSQFVRGPSPPPHRDPRPTQFFLISLF